MSFLKYFKIVWFLIGINSCSCGTKDEKFNELVSCLTSVGIWDQNIIHRDDGDRYIELNFQWNALKGYLTPMAYLIAESVTDIQKAVLCCKKTQIRIVVRGGGHSYAKLSFGDYYSFIVDMSRLNAISHDPKRMTCVIGAGARNGLVASVLYKLKFVIPVGICPSVGITGLALGGGYGYFSRQFGLTSDHILEVEMVTAKGRVLKINNSTHKDLYWALRGGGGGIFGIVTKIKFRMHTAPVSIIHGIYEYSFNDFPQFYRAWQYLIQKTESDVDNIGTIILLSKNKITMEIFNINLKDEPRATVDSTIQYVKGYSFPKKIKSSVDKLSYPEFLIKISQRYSNTKLTDPTQLANITKHIEVGWKKVKSLYVDFILDNDQIKKLHNLLDAFLDWGGLVFLQNGGAMNKFSRTETAFVHRNNLYDIQMWIFDTYTEQATNAMKTFYEESKKVYNHVESYQNYADEDIPDAADRYYKENLRRLLRVKAKYDPESTFY